MDAKRSVRLRVTGRVQGVSFRWATEQEARRLGVTGWVRNEPDGSVAAYAEGPADAVDALVAWAHDGPPSARVASVDVTDVEPETGGGASGFRTTG
ncbi:acylphosphatase [uncultured Nocardioides sp.]|uniref:acylphosphatase n=1 Tax=uncultured Nocardioides sp. TaxID=198441 RepID=UPI00260B1080|nr:acylphosphatase [uncultured Nocardioides sp.]